ncbi:MAG TPA: hypothetical protein VIL97_02605, partial [Thermoanaerobaculia bacterium]
MKTHGSDDAPRESLLDAKLVRWTMVGTIAGLVAGASIGASLGTGAIAIPRLGMLSASGAAAPTVIVAAFLISVSWVI